AGGHKLVVTADLPGEGRAIERPCEGDARDLSVDEVPGRAETPGAGLKTGFSTERPIGVIIAFADAREQSPARGDEGKLFRFEVAGKERGTDGSLDVARLSRGN